jgi:hypothetical protein
MEVEAAVDIKRSAGGKWKTILGDGTYRPPDVFG